jgi:hypothetical protein
MRADEDGPGICTPREPSIRIVLDRLVTVEFRPSSTRTPASLDGVALRFERLPMPIREVASF